MCAHRADAGGARALGGGTVDDAAGSRPTGPTPLMMGRLVRLTISTGTEALRRCQMESFVRC